MLGTVLPVSGCFTKEFFIAGKTLSEIENLLGFHQGRLAGGMTVVALLQLPELDQFEPSGCLDLVTKKLYTPEEPEWAAEKEQTRAGWTVAGLDRLVKVRPGVGHDRSMDPDFHQAPGKGAPQWVVKIPLRGKVVGIVKEYPNGRYEPFDALQFSGLAKKR